MECPICRKPVPDSANYCMQCGCRLQQAANVPETFQAAGERKHVTILFSDLSGYTPMAERLDPEEVKEVLATIFGEITKIIKHFDGFVEKFIGDAVMAVFGVPKAHEDDPVRAVRAAMQMHAAVEKIDGWRDAESGRPLRLHTGINTGLVVTGRVDVEKGTHGLTGDAINLAARLADLAQAGEIVVGNATYCQTVNWFDYERLAPTMVKGKQHPVDAFKVLAAKKESLKQHGLLGRQAVLTGREQELGLLAGIAGGLDRGQGAVVTLCGSAGTGKSRLKRDFKASMAQGRFVWLEGHAYGYTGNVPYFPLVNLLAQVFDIDDGDAAETIKSKVARGVTALLGGESVHLPYIGSLFSVAYQAIEDISPKVWRERMQRAVLDILSSLAEQRPTVFCFEDLHWADPSFVGLLPALLTALSPKAMFLLTYRPSFQLFDGGVPTELKARYTALTLKDLSLSEVKAMLQSLLALDTMPEPLTGIVQLKTGGNPFYIEEMVNSLVESRILVRTDGRWQLSRNVTEADIPATIHGVLTARIDRLGNDSKRILQEASVIGRAFLYRILEKVTQVSPGIDQCLARLEGLDLIRKQAMDPEMEYIFKHALTQEVVYGGLLKKERQAIHERIGRVMEALFADRLAEVYETLSFHFKKGVSSDKAVDYLMKSGQKNFRRFAVTESHRFYQEAFDILSANSDPGLDDRKLFIDLIFDWAIVIYFRGDFKTLSALMASHLDRVERLNDPFRKGMYYAWYGFSLIMAVQQKTSYDYLTQAITIGEAIGSKKIVGYASAWLSFICVALGRLHEALGFAERAIAIAEEVKTDSYIYFKAAGGFAFAAMFTGHAARCRALGDFAIALGQRQSNLRSLSMGHICHGTADMIVGDFQAAICAFQKANDDAGDPFYEHWAKIHLAQSLIAAEKYDAAEQVLLEIQSLSVSLGWEESYGLLIRALLAVIDIARGNLGPGLEILKQSIVVSVDKDLKPWQAMFEHIVGKVYLQMALGKGGRDLRMVRRNLGFLILTLPVAGKRAEYHLKRAIDIADAIGARAVLGPAYLDLAILYKTRKRFEAAKQCLVTATRELAACGATARLQQAEAVSTALA